MSSFFNFFAWVCGLALALSLALGHGLGTGSVLMEHHVLLALGAALLTISLHCLIFGIFTGSGKDTRLLVQDLHLNAEYVKRTKVYKRTVFPPALYAIGWILLATSLGGAVTLVSGNPLVTWAHLFVAWACFFYNVKTMRLECAAVKENGEILNDLNREAAKKVGVLPESELPVLADGTVLEWGTHVYAFGKFLCFLGYNIWLPFIYLRYIVGWLNAPTWIFLVLSLSSLAGGYYLRWRYAIYRPRPGEGPRILSEA